MGALNLLITGASGYLGTSATMAAYQAGHEVRRLGRKDADLAQDDLTGLCDGIDVVIHCAAAMTGDEARMMRDTVTATERLMAESLRAGVRHAVLAGSMSVYGYGDLEPGAEVTEATPLEPRPEGRDAYSRAKLAQERAVPGALPCWLLRIGALWGPGRLWNAHVGLAKGGMLLRTAREGQIPLCHISHASQALIRAAETAPEGHEALNILDSDLPDRPRYLAALKAGGWPRVTLPVSWRVLDTLAGLGLPGMPGLLRRPALRARMMPLRYPNDAARNRLGWSPAMGFDEAMSHAIKAQMGALT